MTSEYLVTLIQRVEIPITVTATSPSEAVLHAKAGQGAAAQSSFLEPEVVNVKDLGDRK